MGKKRIPNRWSPACKGSDTETARLLAGGREQKRLEALEVLWRLLVW